jgi:hypothetical protein
VVVVGGRTLQVCTGESTPRVRLCVVAAVDGATMPDTRLSTDTHTHTHTHLLRHALTLLVKPQPQQQRCLGHVLLQRLQGPAQLPKYASAAACAVAARGGRWMVWSWRVCGARLRGRSHRNKQQHWLPTSAPQTAAAPAGGCPSSRPSASAAGAAAALSPV